MLKIIEDKFDDIKSWIIRNLAWFGIGLLALLYLSFNSQILTTVLISIIFVCLAIGLSGLVAFAYTKLDFIGIKQSNDRPILGQIFIGVSIIITGILIGVYITQFAGV